MSPETSLSYDIEIRHVEARDVSEIADLYRAGGWWQEAWDTEGITPLIKGSSAFVVAIDRKTSRAIGMGRLISDDVSDGYIQDVVVYPQYRKSGIGGRIVSALVASGKSKGLGWIGLIAQPGSELFYTELGFQPMKGHTPMLYKGGD
ncbi:GNAT family N-acetyltransferase [Methanocella arvoryzae]|uniref:Acetyltransferase (GNAT family) n=1 Tax=Methanocella arvoryzae (strain DSM 22066 / NBRC 105507 / MRE50) TaxID=351160 RepID=Q0W0Y1_METAR|nr:GNAT family N-acetyltransferase [Methanocella arvoryzae]CAJ37962.1 putative acetyltransferase (GNAT family) [Methanocella arvoryzae MRE50]